MFNGYYLKIDGTAYPTAFMVIPSYAVDDAPIVVNDYYDADYNHHITKAPKNEITISFNIRSMYSTEFAQAVAPFADTMTIEYYDSKIDGYLTDTFTYEGSLNPKIARQYNNNVLLEELSITLIRKVA